jgi:hypothetical protein
MVSHVSVPSRPALPERTRTRAGARDRGRDRRLRPAHRRRISRHGGEAPLRPRHRGAAPRLVPRRRAGDHRDGATVTIETLEETDGLATYVGQGRRVREDAISDVTSVSLPAERLLAGQTDPGEVFDLRSAALQAQRNCRQSEVRGFLGGRIELIPHQFYILQRGGGAADPARAARRRGRSGQDDRGLPHPAAPARGRPRPAAC